jgi:hypothetical protein
MDDIRNISQISYTTPHQNPLKLNHQTFSFHTNINIRLQLVNGEGDVSCNFSSDTILPATLLLFGHELKPLHSLSLHLHTPRQEAMGIWSVQHSPQLVKMSQLKPHAADPTRKVTTTNFSNVPPYTDTCETMS